MVLPSEGNEVRQEEQQEVVASQYYLRSRGTFPGRTLWRKEGCRVIELLMGNTEDAMESETVSTKQRRIAELARIHPEVSFTSLAYHIDLEWLREAYRRTRKGGVVGVDKQRAEEYEKDLENNLRSLLERAKSGTYFAPPVRRAYIPKDPKGRETRPIGVPTLEDKVLQRAVQMVLEPLYEQEFLDFSYGFRPRRSAHDALETLWKQSMGIGGGWIIDLDIRKFFDTMSHAHIRDILKRRVCDGVLIRLIQEVVEGGSDGGRTAEVSGGRSTPRRCDFPDTQ